MTDDTARTRGFWRSVLGTLTAVAAAITAVGGLLAVLLQLGIIGGSPKAAPVSGQGPQATQSASAASSSHSAAANSSVSGGSWSDAIAVWTTTDGKKITVPAPTMAFCINEGTGLLLDQSQNIAFEKMSKIEILSADTALASPNGVARLHITLTSGESVDGKITANCDFIGFPAAGRINLYPDHLKMIEFVRQ
jgi:hypothetical protein